MLHKTAFMLIINNSLSQIEISVWFVFVSSVVKKYEKKENSNNLARENDINYE